jgi:transposase InsO family protein
VPVDRTIPLSCIKVRNAHENSVEINNQPTKIVLRRPLESAQYAAQGYREALLRYSLVGSMGRRGNPCDNPKAESFMKTLKVDAVYQLAYETFADVA